MDKPEKVGFFLKKMLCAKNDRIVELSETPSVFKMTSLDNHTHLIEGYLVYKYV